MKRISIFALAAMMAFGAASCSKDNAEGTDPSLDGATLSFTFDKPVGSYVTYADIATAGEWAINTLDAYVFKADGTYWGKLGASDYTKTEDAARHTTTITMKPEWTDANVGSTLRFYFVANDAGSTNGAHIANPFAGDENAFKALATKALTDTDNNSKFDNIATPLLFSGVSADVAVTGGKISQTVNLKRRVARFDIVNEIPGRFVISNILISDAREQGYIWADAGAGKSPADFAKVSMESVNVAGLTPAMDGTTANYTSAFYTYPTSLDQTTLAIVADLDGAGAKVWEINSNIAIEANKRYKLLCKPGTTTDDNIVFSVVADDWDEGVKVDVTPKAESVQLGTIGYPEVYENTFFYRSANDDQTVSVPVTSVNGTTAEVSFVSNVGSTLTFDGYTDFATEYAAAINAGRSTAITYAYGMVDTYTFDLPKTSAGDAALPFDIQITFTAKGDATKSTTVRILRVPEVKAVENILAYDPTEGLNLDGVGTPLYFKWGSLIGTDASKPYSGAAFASADVIYAPAGYDVSTLKAAIDAATDNAKWVAVPFADNATYPDALPALDEAAGLGDPCKLAKKSGANVGDFKMPAGNPYNGSTVSGTWGVTDDMPGRTIDGYFYPAAGRRHSITGVVNNVGRSGHYWSSAPNAAYYAYYLTFNSGSDSVNASSYTNRTHGFPVRCVTN